MTTTPSNNLTFVPENTLDPAAGLNLTLTEIDVLLQLAVLTRGDNAPPVSPADGDRHIVGTSPTGDWSGEANRIARYVADGDFWQFYDAKIALNLDDGALYKFIAGAWQELTSSGGVTTFLGQTDTPASYTGQTGRIPQVNAAEDALIFREKSGYGQLNITNNTTAISVTAAVDSTLIDNADYTQITGIWDAAPHGLNKNVTQGTDSFTVNRTGNYRIDVWASALAANNNAIVAVKFGVNGTISLNRRPRIRLPNAGDPGGLAAHGFVSLTAGDIITLWHACTITTNLTWADMVFSVNLLEDTTV